MSATTSASKMIVSFEPSPSSFLNHVGTRAENAATRHPARFKRTPYSAGPFVRLCIVGCIGVHMPGQIRPRSHRAGNRVNACTGKKCASGHTHDPTQPASTSALLSRIVGLPRTACGPESFKERAFDMLPSFKMRSMVSTSRCCKWSGDRLSTRQAAP